MFAYAVIAMFCKSSDVPCKCDMENLVQIHLKQFNYSKCVGPHSDGDLFYHHVCDMFSAFGAIYSQ
jgi:hypothetical protein